ncbi:hypothetical protein P0D69_21760 [Paraburkholderia sediminicola]|uniref:hypothetical protein n=1 Tax=Paraburkholderia sediminicola TaxID=458836 RepID=UPI0038B93C63
MNATELNERDGTLEFAMIVAISTIAGMDESLPNGTVTVTAEEILQAMEKTSPLLVSEIVRCGYREQFLSHIADYGLLRQLVPNWVELEVFLESGRRVFFDDLLYVLDAEKWNVSHPKFHALFLSIAPVIQARLEAAYTMPF